MSGRRSKQLRRLCRMAMYGDRQAQRMVLSRVGIGQATRITNRLVALDSRRATPDQESPPWSPAKAARERARDCRSRAH